MLHKFLLRKVKKQIEESDNIVEMVYKLVLDTKWGCL